MLVRRLGWSTYTAWHTLGQARYPYRPVARILRDQGRRVRSMVAYAYARVPYYRETLDRLGLKPEYFQTARDLARLPLLTPTQIQVDPDYFLANKRTAPGFLPLTSSGSTGQPRTCWQELRALFQSAAHGERERRALIDLIGQRFAYRETKIVPPGSSTLSVAELWEERTFLPPGMRIKRQVLSLLDPAERNLRLMNAFAPDVLYTYGSYLEMLFTHIHAHGEEFHRPRVIIYSSAGVSPQIRSLIMEEYGIPILSSYQAVEAIKIGFECEKHTGQHLNVDIYPVRIINEDGQDVPMGRPGRVVVSNLVNRAMPLLNYLLGDTAKLLAEPCSCGRSLPLMSFPMGRSDDTIELPCGTRLNPQALCRLFRHHKSIWQYQIVQEQPARFMVRLSVAPSCNRTETSTALVRAFKDLLGEEFHVEVQFVETFQPPPNGKHRAVIAYQHTTGT